MDENGMLLGKELALGVIGLLIFGVTYNYGIERFPWLAQRRSAEQVVFGVLITVLVSGFFIGWTNVLTVLILFAASGGPMIIGSWIRAAKDDAEAKKIAKDVLK